jgi:Zn-dependent protease with chaperone function
VRRLRSRLPKVSLNFFDAQDQARRTTRRLVFFYILATSIIVIGVTLIIGFSLYGFTDVGRGISVSTFLVQFAPMLLGIAFLVALFIAGATAFKTAMLSSGGGRVATDLGGTLVPPDVRDPLRRRLRNVVEEMAIASGTPVPEIYVLEQENGINAFAAGFEPSDAAIAVTRGTLELLDRDELQGVIGHEFSHILNGDMRLNIRLMGVLFGIMALGLIGRMILRGGRHGAFIARGRGKGAPVILIIGLGLAVLGGIGVMLSRMIKASVSRQREYLADASAVQFTRQTGGIANALKKIGGYTSRLEADPEEVSHMLFGSGSKLSGMFATHPPLTERIQALDPSFEPADYPEVDLRSRSTVSAAEEERHAGIAAAAATAGAAALPEAIGDMIGRPETTHIAHAVALRESVPVLLYDAAHSSEMAYLLVIALILDRSGRVLSQQLSLAEQQLGRERTALIRRYFDALAETGAEYRLPLMEIAFPALRRRPLPQLDYLVEMAGGMIDIDGEIDIYEYCFYRILVANLEQASNPSHQRKRRNATREPVRQAAVDLLRVVAKYGHADDAERERAFDAGVAVFGKWGQQYVYETDRKYSVEILDESLDMLLALNGEGQQMLLEAISEVVFSDQRLSLTEAELIRAICASLNCPLPPILIDNPVA